MWEVILTSIMHLSEQKLTVKVQPRMMAEPRFTTL